MYKLIVNQTTEGPTPFYRYIIEDAKGYKVGNVTKAVITIDAENDVYPKMTMHKKWVKEGQIKEETIEDVSVDIQTRTSPSQ